VHFRAIFFRREGIDEALDRAGRVGKSVGYATKFRAATRRGGLKPLRTGKSSRSPVTICPRNRQDFRNQPAPDRDGIVPEKHCQARTSHRAARAAQSVDRTVRKPTPIRLDYFAVNLLKKLFTVKGAGTLIKQGSAVLDHRSYRQRRHRALAQLLEASFGRALDVELFERARCGVVEGRVPRWPP